MSEDKGLLEIHLKSLEVEIEIEKELQRQREIEKNTILKRTEVLREHYQRVATLAEKDVELLDIQREFLTLKLRAIDGVAEWRRAAATSFKKFDEDLETLCEAVIEETHREVRNARANVRSAHIQFDFANTEEHTLEELAVPEDLEASHRKTLRALSARVASIAPNRQATAAAQRQKREQLEAVKQDVAARRDRKLAKRLNAESKQSAEAVRMRVGVDVLRRVVRAIVQRQRKSRAVFARLHGQLKEERSIRSEGLLAQAAELERKQTVIESTGLRRTRLAVAVKVDATRLRLAALGVEVLPPTMTTEQRNAEAAAAAAAASEERSARIRALVKGQSPTQSLRAAQRRETEYAVSRAVVQKREAKRSIALRRKHDALEAVQRKRSLRLQIAAGILRIGRDSLRKTADLLDLVVERRQSTQTTVKELHLRYVGSRDWKTALTELDLAIQVKSLASSVRDRREQQRHTLLAAAQQSVEGSSAFTSGSSQASDDSHRTSDGSLCRRKRAPSRASVGRSSAAESAAHYLFSDHHTRGRGAGTMSAFTAVADAVREEALKEKVLRKQRRKYGHPAGGGGGGGGGDGVTSSAFSPMGVSDWEMVETVGSRVGGGGVNSGVLHSTTRPLRTVSPEVTVTVDAPEETSANNPYGGEVLRGGGVDAAFLSSTPQRGATSTRPISPPTAFPSSHPPISTLPTSTAREDTGDSLPSPPPLTGLTSGLPRLTPLTDASFSPTPNPAQIPHPTLLSRGALAQHTAAVGVARALPPAPLPAVAVDPPPLSSPNSVEVQSPHSGLGVGGGGGGAGDGTIGSVLDGGGGGGGDDDEKEEA